MDTNLKFILDGIKDEMENVEKRIEAKLDQMQRDITAIKDHTDDLRYFKAKVLGGSAAVAFLVTLLVSAVFNK